MKRLLPLLLMLGACDNMARQPRYDAYGSGRLFADGKAMQTPPVGVVARDARAWAAEERRPPMTLGLIERGRDRYRIYCSMCHGIDGSGAGTVTARGFPRPAGFRAADQQALGSEQIYRSISDGAGVMYGFRDRVPPRDRWAIAAYVEALQKAGRP